MSKGMEWALILAGFWCGLCFSLVGFGIWLEYRKEWQRGN